MVFGGLNIGIIARYSIRGSFWSSLSGSGRHVGLSGAWRDFPRSRDVPLLQTQGVQVAVPKGYKYQYNEGSDFLYRELLI